MGYSLRGTSRGGRSLATIVLATIVSVLIALTVAMQEAEPAFAARAKSDNGGPIWCNNGQAWIKVASKGDTYVAWTWGRQHNRVRYYNGALRTRYINTHISFVDYWRVKVLNENGYLYTQATYGLCS